MTDLRARFSSADELPAPDLWREIETRALAMSAAPAPGPAWLMIGLAALLMVGIGSAVLFGSGLVELPVLPEPSPSESIGPSPTVDASPAESESPVLGPNDISSWTAVEGLGPGPRFGYSATLLPDGRVLLAGVLGEVGSNESAALLDPVTMTWTQTADMLEVRTDHTATLSQDGRMVLVTGGLSWEPGVDPRVLNSTEAFDLETQQWISFPSMTSTRSGHTATLLLDGRLLVTDGNSDGSTTISTEVFDLNSLSWTPSGHIGGAGPEHTQTLLNDGRVLEVGEIGAQLYDPNTGEWSTTAGPSARHGCHTATRLVDGRVLIAGGPCGSNTGFTPSAELFDPESETWSATGAMTEGRGWHAANLLRDGRVLVAGGGYGYSEPTFRTAELYDPTTGSWIPTASMISERTAFTAITLTDGRVLAIGSPADVPEFEVYDPDGGN